MEIETLSIVKFVLQEIIKVVLLIFAQLVEFQIVVCALRVILLFVIYANKKTIISSVPVDPTYAQIKDLILNMEIKIHIHMRIVLIIVSTALVLALINVINATRITVISKRTVSV